MDDTQKAAYIISQTACATIEAQGMAAENWDRAMRSESAAYTEEDFSQLLEKYGIHHNAVLSFFHPN